MKTYKARSTAIALIILLLACKQEDPVIPNEEELITSLIYTLTPEAGGDPVVFSFADSDGDGGNPPIFNEDTLMDNAKYTGSILLLNESIIPAENISMEVATEAEFHQMFYQISAIDLTINYSDQDANKNPIGLTTTVNSGAPGNGILTITLRHNPDKTASGVSEGNITNAGGETDIEVNFHIVVQ